MREIQNLTLQIDRGMAAVERRFEERRERFSREYSRFRNGGRSAVGLRFTTLPLTPLYVDRVHNTEAVRPPLHELRCTIGGSKSYSLFVPVTDGPWRPIIRGSVADESHDAFALSREVHCEGLIEYSLMLQERAGEHPEPLRLPVQWVMGMFGNPLCATEKFRRAAGAPDVEYALVFEIINSEDLSIGKYGGPSFGDWLGPFPRGDEVFPPYSVGPAETFQQLSHAFERDFWNGAGHDWNNLAVVDFGRALRELGIPSGATSHTE